MSDKTNYILIHESVAQSWLRDLSSFVLFFALIGVGVWVSSAAMQWAGFVVAVVVTLNHVSKLAPKRMTRSEAIAFLQSEDAA